jgi:hypothetical protein
MQVSLVLNSQLVFRQFKKNLIQQINLIFSLKPTIFSTISILFTQKLNILHKPITLQLPVWRENDEAVSSRNVNEIRWDGAVAGKGAVLADSILFEEL